MVRGLDLFTQHFAGYADRYVLIGGVAATLAMDEAGLPFRVTKDIDIVLVVEALDADFAREMWRFITAGGYAIKQTGDGARKLYRFAEPADDRYPVMIELFSRRPEGLALANESELTPLPIDEAASSLSAILLDDDYYAFVIDGRQQGNVPRIGADRLIPLKASAWLDLSARRAAGEKVDSRNVRKHINDVFRLSQLLPGDAQIAITGKVREDLMRFLAQAEGEEIDLPNLGIRRASQREVLARISQAYGLQEQVAAQ